MYHRVANNILCENIMDVISFSYIQMGEARMLCLEKYNNVLYNVRWSILAGMAVLSFQ